MQDLKPRLEGREKRIQAELGENQGEIDSGCKSDKAIMGDKSRWDIVFE